MERSVVVESSFWQTLSVRGMCAFRWQTTTIDRDYVLEDVIASMILNGDTDRLAVVYDPKLEYDVSLDVILEAIRQCRSLQEFNFYGDNTHNSVPWLRALLEVISTSNRVLNSLTEFMLEEVDLNFQPQCATLIAKIISSAPKLKRIQLTSCELRNNELYTMCVDGILRNKSINILRIDKNERITDGSILAEVIKVLRRNIERLILARDFRFRDKGVAQICEALEESDSIKELNLRDMVLVHSGLAIGSLIAVCPSLKLLRVEQNMWTQKSIDSLIAGLESGLCSVEYLSIGYYEPSVPQDQFSSTAKRLANCRSLTSLKFENMGDFAFRNLCEVLNDSSIKKLEIACTAEKEFALDLTPLAFALQGSQLESLKLTNLFFTESFSVSVFTTLQSNKSLLELELTGGFESVPGVEEVLQVNRTLTSLCASDRATKARLDSLVSSLQNALNIVDLKWFGLEKHDVILSLLWENREKFKSDLKISLMFVVQNILRRDRQLASSQAFRIIWSMAAIT
jgi:hypothetical protein